MKFIYLSESVVLFKHIKARPKSKLKKKINGHGVTKIDLDSISSFAFFELASLLLGDGISKSVSYGRQPEEFDIIRSNSTNFGHLESNIGKKLWNLISNLGVQSDFSNKDFVLKINEMQKADKHLKLGRNEKINLNQ